MDKTLSNAERIWRAVQAIPEGKVTSYGQVADLAGLPGRARFVSRAMGQAPKDLQLPWHRVLRSNGHIAFPKDHEYALIQSKRLQEEGVNVIKNRVELAEFGWRPELHEILSKLDF